MMRCSIFIFILLKKVKTTKTFQKFMYFIIFFYPKIMQVIQMKTFQQTENLNVLSQDDELSRYIF